MSEEYTKGDVSPRVLVVEDEENVRDLLLTVLAENGYRVDAVRSGEEALRQLDQQLYDLVLLDLNLPGMHGLNVLGAGPALQTDAQFIVMTAFGSIDSAVEAMKLGAVDFIKTGGGAAPEPDQRRSASSLGRQVAGDAATLRTDRAGRTDAGQRAHHR